MIEKIYILILDHSVSWSLLKLQIAVAGGTATRFLRIRRQSNFFIFGDNDLLDWISDLLHFLVVYGMNSMSRLDNLSVESGVFVSSVVNSTGGAVRFNQLVVTFNIVTVTFLSLFLDVVSVGIMDSVLELVLRMSLEF